MQSSILRLLSKKHFDQPVVTGLAKQVFVKPVLTNFMQQLDGESSTMNMLLTSVANQRDAAAAVYIYDKMKEMKIPVDEISWIALNKLEKSKHQSIYVVPVTDKKTLHPSRRIHKICKGPRLHARSEAAKEVLSEAKEWLKTVNPEFYSYHRIKKAKIIAEALQIPLETARGVVTKLR